MGSMYSTNSKKDMIRLGHQLSHRDAMENGSNPYYPKKKIKLSYTDMMHGHGLFHFEYK